MSDPSSAEPPQRAGARAQRPLGKSRQDGQRYCEACQKLVGGTA
ncbi:hypothetical protein ABT352_23195 [Streptosporangium sp. NPDC000563]